MGPGARCSQGNGDRAMGLRVSAAESGQLNILGFPALLAGLTTGPVTSFFSRIWSVIEWELLQEDPNMGNCWYECTFVGASYVDRYLDAPGAGIELCFLCNRHAVRV
jgi:hypothetical protein